MSEFATTINLPITNMNTTITGLQRNLAEAVMLWSITKTAHYNVQGMGFGPLHELFGELADLALTQADDLAERIAQLGGYAEGTAYDAVGKSTLLSHAKMRHTRDRDCLDCLVHCWGSYANLLRKQIDSCGEDRVTENMVTDMAQEADKGTWKLQAHLR